VGTGDRGVTRAQACGSSVLDSLPPARVLTNPINLASSGDKADQSEGSVHSDSELSGLTSINSQGAGDNPTGGQVGDLGPNSGEDPGDTPPSNSDEPDDDESLSSSKSNDSTDSSDSSSVSTMSPILNNW